MNEHDDQRDGGGRLTRRDSLLKLGGLAATAVGAAPGEPDSYSATRRRRRARARPPWPPVS
jgi:hypothetical protein